MSIAERFRKTEAILWRKSSSGDGYGDTYESPTIIKVNYKAGGKLTRDNAGQEFTPSMTISSGVIVSSGDYIRIRNAKEPMPTAPDDSAQQIRQVIEGQPLRGAADYLILTS